MALTRRDDITWTRLLEAAAADVRAHNPHIGARQELPLDELTTQLRQDSAELEHVWDEIDEQRIGAISSYTVADAVNEDRGE